MARVHEVLHAQIASLLYELRDLNALGLIVSITRVEASRDLRVAKVFFLCEDDRAAEVAEVLQKAAGYLHRELYKSVHMKRVPSLQFVFDNTLSQGTKMIDKLGKGLE